MSVSKQKNSVRRRLANRVRPVSRQIQQQRLNIFMFFVQAHNIIIIIFFLFYSLSGTLLEIV